MSNIKRVYVALPELLIHKVYSVQRSRRTNPLSHIEGGFDVVVEYHNQKVFGYDWIKTPSSYVSQIFHNDYTDDYDFESMDSIEKLEIVKNIISTMYVRSYKNDNEYHTAAYEKIWDSRNATDLPWDILREIELQAVPPQAKKM